MWALAWKFVTPVILVSISVLSWVHHVPMKYDDYEFPPAVEAFGWIIELLPLFIVLLYPLFPLYKAWSQGFSGKGLYEELFKPTNVWYETQMDRRMTDLKNAAAAKSAKNSNQGCENGDQSKQKDENPPAYNDEMNHKIES